MNNNFRKPKPFSLKKDRTLDEEWVKDRIAEDPSILGLGDLELEDRERQQPGAGRVDLLLKKRQQRYEVEVQLGATDESHIIRTIEYWDIERKRYPQYDHCAVIIAEDITSRFLNVISLFNGTLPLIAIQMQAINLGEDITKLGEDITVSFTKVLDSQKHRPSDKAKKVLDSQKRRSNGKAKNAGPFDRVYWEKEKATTETVALADHMLDILREFDSSLNLKYTKHFINLEKDGKPFNFVNFRAWQEFLGFQLKLPSTPKHDKRVKEANLEFSYQDSHKHYYIKLKKDDILSKSGTLKELSQLAYNNFQKRK